MSCDFPRHPVLLQLAGMRAGVHICHGQGCQEPLLQRPQGLVTIYSIIQTKISLRVKRALVITQVKRQNQDCSGQTDVWSVSVEQTAQLDHQHKMPGRWAPSQEGKCCFSCPYAFPEFAVWNLSVGQVMSQVH